MRWFWQRKAEEFDLNELIRRLEVAANTSANEQVGPDTCLRAPTMQAIDTAVSRRIAVSTVRVMRAEMDGERERKRLLPDHPVQQLLDDPNEIQSHMEYWLDATSALVRWGNFYAELVQGGGRARRLRPIYPGSVQIDELELVNNGRLVYRVTYPSGRQREVPGEQMHHVRLRSLDFVNGASPVHEIRDAIALEIAAEKYGAEYFGNGALPLFMFTFMQGVKGFQTTEEEEAFKQSFQKAYGKGARHSALLIPKGLEVNTAETKNDNAQFLETRKYQRTVIAGAYGVPPHLVGDLERGTFNNVEQQDKDFVINVVLPFARVFEAAMERDLLSDEDRDAGVVIRFNLDEINRADFKSRQEGLRIQRDAGVISPNDWRERENMNPIPEDDGGEDYIRAANFVVAGEEQTVEMTPDGNDTTNGIADDQGAE